MAYFTGKYIPDNNSIKGDKTLFKIGFVSMLAIMMHNIPEGIVTFVATNAEVKLGIYLAIAIAMPLLASAADKSTGWSVPEPDRRDASIDARQHCRPMLL